MQDNNQGNGGNLGNNQTQPHVGAGGNVNFENNLVPNNVVQDSASLETSPHAEAPQLGNIRILGNVQVADQQPVVAEVKELSHILSAEINVTLNTGLTFIKGTKELKSLELLNKATGTTEKYNYYNPFVRSDKDRHTGEGVLRKTFASMASIIHRNVGREIVFFNAEGFGAGSIDATAASVEKFVGNVVKELRAEFPQGQDDPLFETEIVLHDGSEITRPVSFGELFSVNAWVVSYLDDTGCVMTHTAVFNIGLNIGALYDSNEPHAFVLRAQDFVQKQLASVGLDGLVNFNVNYAFNSVTLEDAEVRELLEILVAENGYTVVSKAGVTTGQYPWAGSGCAELLFGFGCDLILRSPDEVLEEEEEVE
jgi:hypothetical protein